VLEQNRHDPRASTLDKIVQAFERAGVEFLGGSQGNPEVRLRQQAAQGSDAAAIGAR